MRRRIRRPERLNAQLLGELKYFTGRPCKHGHLAHRYTATGHCVPCRSRDTVASRRKHLQRSNAADRARYAQDPGKDLAKQARRRALKANQLCGCCTAADFRAVYRAAAVLRAEVDHRLPLTDGGAHCCKNLQILMPADHRTKTAQENRLRFRAVA